MTNDVKNVPGLRFPGFEDVWKEKNLGRVLDIKSGKAYKENEYTIKGVPLLQGENINHNKLKKPTVFLPDSYLNDNKNTILEKDDIVVGLNRPIIKNQLKIAKVSNEFIPGILYQRSGKIIYDKSKPDFYLNFFDKQIKEFVLKESVGSDQPFISTIQLKKKRVYIPVNENEIVLLNHFFSKLDRQIELEEQKLSLLEEQKKGYMQKIFSQELRFKNENGNNYPDWEVKKIGEIMDVASVKRIHQSDWTNEGVKFIRARDIVSRYKGKIVEDPLFISKERYEEYSKLSGKVKIGDLLVTGVGTIGVPLLINNEKPIYFKDGNIIWLKNEDNIDKNFLFYSFISRKTQNFIKSVAGIGTVGTYTISNAKKTPILLPVSIEQVKIGNFFNELDKSIKKQNKKVDLLKERKKGLLQKMFI